MTFLIASKSKFKDIYLILNPNLVCSSDIYYINEVLSMDMISKLTNTGFCIFDSCGMVYFLQDQQIKILCYIHNTQHISKNLVWNFPS